MTATEELRRLLDERGVEWWNETDPQPQKVTMARIGDRLVEYYENVNDTIGYHVWPMHDLTPEQAVEATLGRGECKVEEYEDTGLLVCSECGAVQPDEHTVYYCWCCGRKVEG